jgi:hypothetical protein
MHGIAHQASKLVLQMDPHAFDDRVQTGLERI